MLLFPFIKLSVNAISSNGNKSLYYTILPFSQLIQIHPLITIIFALSLSSDLKWQIFGLPQYRNPQDSPLRSESILASVADCPWLTHLEFNHLPPRHRIRIPLGDDTQLNTLDTRDQYKLLKKLPAVHECFFQKRIMVFPLYTSPRYFVIKSRYLLCFGKEESEFALKWKEQYKDRVESDLESEGKLVHQKVTPKYIIPLDQCKITSDEKGDFFFIYIRNSYGKNLTLRTLVKGEFDSMLRSLSLASIAPNKKDFQYLGVLGKGSFGEVTLVLHVPTQTKYALKKAYVQTNSLLKHCLEERAIFERVSGHPYIVSLKFAFKEERTLYYVQQYCPGGDLYGILRKRGAFPESVAQFYGAEILLALGHLHSHHIIHRDIKPENVLVDEAGHALLTDFGLSKLLDDSRRAHTLCGTELYYPPELYIRSDFGYDISLDFWQYGCMMFELLTDHAPFKSHTKQERVEKVLHSDPEIPETLQPATRQFLKWLLEKDPTSRPHSAEDLQKHDFFNGIDWELLLHRQIDPPKWEVDEKILRNYIQDSRPLQPVLYRLDSNWELDLVGFDYAPN